MKNKIALGLFIILGCCFYYLNLTPHFNLDSFCLFYQGFASSSYVFLNAGRLFTYLLFNLFDLLNVSYNVGYYISSILGVISLSVASYILFTEIKTNEKYIDIIIFLGSFLFFFNYLTIEYFAFFESGIICLGVLFVTLSSKYYFKSNYYLSILFIVLGIICYQGTLAFFIPIQLILYLKYNRKSFIKDSLLTLLLYGISFVVSLIVLKMFGNTGGVGQLNIIENIKISFELMIFGLSSMYYYVNTNIYYIILFVMTFMAIGLLIYHKEWYKLVMLLFVIFVCIVMPYVPNLFVSSDLRGGDNYSAARLCGSLGAIFAVCVIVLSTIKLKKATIIVIALVAMFNSFYMFITYKRILSDGILAYNNNNIILESIVNIAEDNRIETIKYVAGDSKWFNFLNTHTTFSEKVTGSSWGNVCGINCVNTNSESVNSTSVISLEEYNVMLDGEQMTEHFNYYIINNELFINFK